MGFYGNVTSNTKSQFSFDKIYPNRSEMENAVNSDGVFVGRFVLVDYDKDDETIRPAYKDWENENHFLYSDSTLEIAILFNKQGIVLDDINITGVNIGDICYVVTENKVIYYQCYGSETVDNLDYALFEAIAEKPDAKERWNYSLNYQKDESFYGNIGRGWDSTVWQKVYENYIEKYVMVAELNSVVPTFNLSVDAPTLTPIAPHFDEVSNSNYYEIHWQPQWGLRVKSANGFLNREEREVGAPFLSDEITTWVKEIYNDINKKYELYYYGIDEEWHYFERLEEIPENGLLPADIYYNKAGFNPNIHFESSEKDKIAVSPTGISEKPIIEKNGDVNWFVNEYNDHSRGTTAVKEDTQELSIILPSLGNAVNKMWDIFYGTGVDEEGNDVDEKEKNKSYERRTYIRWEDPENDSKETLETKRLRFIDRKKDGFITYEPKDAETVAGLINSVHDLMGMIIVDKSNSDLIKDQEWVTNTASENNIYYFSKVPEENEEITEDNYYAGYYRKAINYDYTPVDYYFEEIIESPEDNYEPHCFYIEDNGQKVPDRESVYDSNKTYFKRKIDPITEQYEEFKEIDLLQYTPRTYFYKSGNDYIRDDSELARDVRYYVIDSKTAVKEPIELTYYKDFYYKKIDGSYKLATEEIPNKKGNVNLPVYETEYYNIKPEKVIPQLNLLNYENWEAEIPDKPIKYFWVPGCFATFEDVVQADGEIGQDYVFTALDSEYDPEQTYYFVEWEWQHRYNLKGELYWKMEPIRAFEVELIQFNDPENPQTYYAFNQDTKDYDIIHENDIIEEYALLSPHYRPVPKDEQEVQNIVYPMTHAVIFEEVSGPYIYNNFYLPSTYYYLEEDNYILDINEEMHTYINENGEEVIREYWNLEKSISDIEINFYVPNKYYYKVDDNPENKQYQLDKSFIKEDKQYYVKNDFYVINDLEGLYSKGATWNRRADFVPWTVELATRKPRYEMIHLDGFGRTLNTINGLILELNKLMLKGDPHTRDRGTVQGAINTLNDIIDRFDHLIPDQMLTTDTYGRVHSTPFNGDDWIKMTLKSHPDETFFKVTHMYPRKKENTINNYDENNIFIGTDLNKTKEDTIDLETISIDETGHIINTHTETYILPYGYKTFNTDEGNSIANNTQDILNVYGDSWIKTTAQEDQINLIHLYPGKENNTTSSYNVNKNGNTIDLETISIDETGHVKKINTETVTLPFGYKTFNADQGTSEADNTQDTMSIIGDSWITTLAENDKISLSHIGPVETSIVQESNQTPAFGSTFIIKDLYFDNKGHKANESSHTIMIPKGSLIDESFNGGDAIIQLSFEDTSGKLSTTRKNIGQLLLKGYSKPEMGLISEDKTINEAFNLLDAGLIKEIKDRETAITEAVKTEVSDRNNAIKTEIQKLDVSEINGISPNKTISKWSETDGIVNITLQDISISSTAINDLAKVYDPAGKTAVTGEIISQAINSLGLGTMATKDANSYVLTTNIGTMATQETINYLTKEEIISNYVSIEEYKKLQQEVSDLKDLINSYHSENLEEEQ